MDFIPINPLQKVSEWEDKGYVSKSHTSEIYSSKPWWAVIYWYGISRAVDPPDSQIKQEETFLIASLERRAKASIFYSRFPVVPSSQTKCRRTSMMKIKLRLIQEINRHAIISALKAGRQGLAGAKPRGKYRGQRPWAETGGKDKVQNSVRFEIQVKL